MNSRPHAASAPPCRSKWFWAMCSYNFCNISHLKLLLNSISLICFAVANILGEETEKRLDLA